MPKYYFDVLFETGLVIDSIGTNLPDAAAAKEEAGALLTELSRDKLHGADPSNISVTVRSEDDTPVLAGKISIEITEVSQRPGEQAG